MTSNISLYCADSRISSTAMFIILSLTPARITRLSVIGRPCGCKNYRKLESVALFLCCSTTKFPHWFIPSKFRYEGCWPSARANMADSTRLRIELDFCSETLSEGSFSVDPDLILIRTYCRYHVIRHTSHSVNSAGLERRREGSLMFETKPYVPSTRPPVLGDLDRDTRATSHGQDLAT